MAADDQAELVQQACPHCLLVYNHGLDHVAGRYAALYELIQTEVWQNKVAGKYQYIYFPEDEIVQSVDSVNRYAHRWREQMRDLLLACGLYSSCSPSEIWLSVHAFRFCLLLKWHHNGF